MNRAKELFDIIMEESIEVDGELQISDKGLTMALHAFDGVDPVERAHVFIQTVEMLHEAGYNVDEELLGMNKRTLH